MSGEFSKKDNINKKTIYLRGVIIGTLLTLISMLAFALVLLLTDIDRSYATPFATISVAIGSFTASRYTAKKIGQKGYIVGFFIGLIVFVIITLLSFVFGDNGLNINTLFHFIIIILSSIAGGISGVNNQKQKKYI